MVKQKLLTISAAAFIGLSSTGVVGGMFIPSGALTVLYPGIVTKAPIEHLIPTCIINTENLLCLNPVDIPGVVSIWLDYGMTAATALDYGASMSQGDRTIDAKNAIKALEEALAGGTGGGSCGGGDTSGDASLASVYTAEMVLAQIEVVKVAANKMFENTRNAIKEYLFETPAPDIKGDCTQSDRDCAVARQSEWLLASVALASATADKVLDQTVKKNVQDGKTEAEKSADEQGEGDTQATGGGATTLTAHFQQLASNFNSATSPTGLYNKMADIVLDTHRQVNDANALLGRDLEAQGLRAVTETGPVLFEEETEE